MRTITSAFTTLSVVKGRSAFFQHMAMRWKSPRKNKNSSRPYSKTTVLKGGSSTPTKLSAAPFHNAPLWRGSAIIVAVNCLGFLINCAAPHVHYHVDLLGTGAFAAAALPSLLGAANKRIIWSSAAVATWSVKLASFLLYRVLQTGHDSRLDTTLASPTSAAGFWAISALWGLLCSLPHALGTTSSLAGNPIALRAGAVMFGAGFLTETLADYQKWAFKSAHPGQFCNVGVWSVSQHPNWLGNFLLWSGIFMMNAPALIEQAPSSASIWKKVWGYRRFALAFMGPAFMWKLFEGQAAGTILGDSMQATHEKYGYGKDATFTNYIDATPLIIPNPLKWFS